MVLTDLEAVLPSAVAEVAETMFFTAVLGELTAPASPQEPPLCAALSFSGTASGAFTIAVSARAARAMASAFLGVEQEDLAPEQTAQVVCELANMVAGASLSAADGKARFALSHPEMAAGIEQAAARWFELDAGVLGVAVSLVPAVVRLPAQTA